MMVISKVQQISVVVDENSKAHDKSLKCATRDGGLEIPAPKIGLQHRNPM